MLPKSVPFASQICPLLPNLSRCFPNLSRFIAIKIWFSVGYAPLQTITNFLQTLNPNFTQRKNKFFCVCFLKKIGSISPKKIKFLPNLLADQNSRLEDEKNAFHVY
ncbi:hypothetical protein DR864_28525 (plasmid) [Runella rosea]|uniref:Uncharacterized protein n=1 Tax=Runella rosea TaxID=2259595 RepID=A0A344TT48_9BACT|nr:hypothetical protein DR864_28525 [Runella rosea]